LYRDFTLKFRDRTLKFADRTLEFADGEQFHRDRERLHRDFTLKDLDRTPKFSDRTPVYRDRRLKARSPTSAARNRSLPELILLGTPKQEPYGTVAVFKDLYGNLWDWVERKANSAKSPSACE
jgi:hypothetical protein